MAENQHSSSAAMLTDILDCFSVLEPRT